jgi:histidyl-tRNA synthetase
MAFALGASFAVTIGPDEWKLGKMKLKKMATGEEVALDFTNVRDLLRKVG